MKTNTSKKVKVQKMGAFLSAEVMPNIGAVSYTHLAY